jgi:radical SAM protein with 4Fe4S-binding SPASM domain
VVGTNGTLLDDARIASLMDAGVTGVAVSIDSLDARYHDRFRHGDGALADTLAAVERMRAAGLDFVIQTSVTRGNRAELPAIAAWAAGVGAVSFNVYFLVATGRGTGMAGLSPLENDEVLSGLVDLEERYRGRMLVRAKCQPQIMRHVHQRGGDSPLLNYATRCPCGLQYCRITPEGRVTPCPYSPAEAGDLRSQSFAEVWDRSPVFASLREGTLKDRCGRCEDRVVCGGCRARAYADTGDMLRQDPSCGYVPTDAPLVMPAKAVTYGQPQASESMPWSDEARERIARVPGFVRGVVVARVENFARERGFDAVTPDVMDAVRKEMPLDFSRRMPFFMRR